MRKKHSLGIQTTLLLLFCAMAVAIQAAPKPTLERIEPSFWWVGFKNPDLQLLVHGDQISITKPVISYPGVVLESVVSVRESKLPLPQS